MTPAPKKSSSSAVKSHWTWKNTGYEVKEKKTKKFEFKERVTSARLACERYKFTQKELSKHSRCTMKHKYFGDLTYQTSLPWHLALNSGSPTSLLLFYCQRNMLNAQLETKPNFVSPPLKQFSLMLAVFPVSLALYCCQRHLSFWRQ